MHADPVSLASNTGQAIKSVGIGHGSAPPALAVVWLAHPFTDSLFTLQLLEHPLLPPASPAHCTPWMVNMGYHHAVNSGLQTTTHGRGSVFASFLLTFGTWLCDGGKNAMPGRHSWGNNGNVFLKWVWGLTTRLSLVFPIYCMLSLANCFF